VPGSLPTPDRLIGTANERSIVGAARQREAYGRFAAHGTAYAAGGMPSWARPTPRRERVLPHEAMRSPNEQLRFAREQLPSWRTPGERLSRQELAEMVNQWIFDHCREAVELAENYIGKLVRHEVAWDERKVSMKDG
jgi:hypothetical protein